MIIRLLVLMIGVSSALAQGYQQLDGAWIHAQFIAELRNSASVGQAYSQVRADQPLWIEIDSSNAEGTVRLSFTGRDTVLWILRRVPRLDSTLQWAIGPEDGPQAGPHWWLSLDERGGTYIALVPVREPSAAPVVYGKLPSPRQEASFILHRMVYASLVAGRYRDATNQVYEFQPSMKCSWKGARVLTSLALDASGSPILTVEYANKHRESYRVDRQGSTLTLINTDAKASTIVLERIQP
ncbi:MAG: hypothetical protein ACO3E0_06500 [Candidatus Kapaibacteriota bacterium]